MANAQVMTIRGEDEFTARAAPLFSDIRTEFLCAATELNTWSKPEQRRAIARRMHTNLASGVAVRKLYTSTALADAEQRDHLFTLAAAGATVRISPSALPHETLIIDRKVMILAGGGSGADREFTLTTSPALIGGITALLDSAWDNSTELSGYLGRDLPRLEPEQRAVLEALSTGLTDATGARRTGLSLRTYRRRVADLLARLDAGSRFQAGTKAAALGLVP